MLQYNKLNDELIGFKDYHKHFKNDFEDAKFGLSQNSLKYHKIN